jgi:hypothetical protein
MGNGTLTASEMCLEHGEHGGEKETEAGGNAFYKSSNGCGNWLTTSGLCGPSPDT